MESRKECRHAVANGASQIVKRTHAHSHNRTHAHPQYAHAYTQTHTHAHAQTHTSPRGQLRKPVPSTGQEVLSHVATPLRCALWGERPPTSPTSRRPSSRAGKHQIPGSLCEGGQLTDEDHEKPRIEYDGVKPLARHYKGREAPQEERHEEGREDGFADPLVRLPQLLQPKPPPLPSHLTNPNPRSSCFPSQ